MSDLKSCTLEPLRPADYRYRRAWLLLEHRKRPTRLDDEKTITLKEFLQRRRDSTYLNRRLGSCATDRFLREAFSLFENAASQTRWILEARLLANESAETVAKRFGISAEAVSWYASAFYDVQDQLDRTDFILSEIIGRDTVTGSAIGRLWKLVAYIGGSGALTRVLCPFAFSNDCDPKALVRTLLEQKAGVAAYGMNAEANQGAELIRAYTKFIATEAKVDANTPNLTDLERHIKAAVDSMPFMVGMEAEKHLSPAIAEYDRGAAELRDDELLRVGAGEILPTEAEIKSLKLPDTQRPGIAGSSEQRRSAFDNGFPGP